MLVLRSLKSTNAQIGRWGRLEIVPGYYVYVGSAFGPGGVPARISRHCKKQKTRHWHIDYLREHAEPLFVWYSFDPKILEHRWAQALTKMTGLSPVKGFGCTDCKCLSHLFVSEKKPLLARFTNAVGSPVKTWVLQPDG